MANYADYIQFPDTVIGGNYVERYAFGGILSQAPKELVDLVQAAMSDESAA
jgi:hypothetical protein